MFNFIKKWFKKEIIVKNVIEFQPIKRPIDKNIMFANEAQAKQFFDLVYNNVVQYFLNQQQEKALVCQDILRDIKTLSDIHGSKINFNATQWVVVARNTQQ